MAYSVARYTGDGSTALFTIPFPFLDRSHVSGSVNGSPVALTWLNDSLVQILPAPVNGTAVVILRSSSPTLRLVDFQDAQVLTEVDLDLSATQTFYLVQEAYDAAETITIPASITAAAASAVAAAAAAALSETNAASSASSASTSAINAAASAASAAATVGTITNKVDKSATNALSTLFRANIDPNVTYDLVGNTIAATFNLSPTVNPSIASGKELDVFRTAMTATTVGINSILACHRSTLNLTAASNGDAYGYYTKVTNLGGGNVYGLFAHTDATGAAGGAAYPLYVRTTGSTGGTIITAEVDGTCSHGLDINGINSGTLAYGVSVTAGVTVSGAAFQYSKANGGGSAFIMFDSPANAFAPLFELDSLGWLNMLGTGQRIRGDMSNAVLANQLAFQSKTLNGNTFLNVLPNGTATNGIVQAYNKADPTNAALVKIQCSTAGADLTTATTGTGTAVPLRFLVNGALAGQFNAASGRLTLGSGGVDDALSQLQVRGATGITASLTLEATGATQFTRIIQKSVEHEWRIVTDSTPSWFIFDQTNAAQRFTIDATGNVNINNAAAALKVGGTQVVNARKTGWTAPTGTATKTTFATSTVTLSVLAEHVKALIDDLTSHGLIGT
jgi:hypothetical protein